MYKVTICKIYKIAVFYMKNKIAVNLQQNLLVSMWPAKSFAVTLRFFSFFYSIEYLHKELGTMLQPMHGSTSAPNVGTKFHQYTVTTSLASCFGEMLSKMFRSVTFPRSVSFTWVT